MTKPMWSAVLCDG